MPTKAKNSQTKFVVKFRYGASDASLCSIIADRVINNRDHSLGQTAALSHVMLHTEQDMIDL